MIKWKNTREKGVVALGEEEVSNQSIKWFISKSPAGLAYQLHVGEVKKVPMVTRATVSDCKTFAEEYF